jgi:hypothetical protein
MAVGVSLASVFKKFQDTATTNDEIAPNHQPAFHSFQVLIALLIPTRINSERKTSEGVKD